MYVASFQGCRAKIERAREHLDALEAALNSACEDKANCAELRADLDEQSGFHVVSLKYAPDLSPVSEAIGLAVGDVVHNLRCALDHAVWQLASQNQQGIPLKPQQVMFPIVDCPSAFAKACKPGAALGEVDPVHQMIIGSLQPYWGEADPSRREWNKYVHELTLVRDISNTDKHRVPATILSSTTSFELFFEPAYDSRGIPDRDHAFEPDHRWKCGSQVMRERLSPGHHLPIIEPNMEMVGYARPWLSVEAGGPVVQDLGRMADYVSVVVDRLEAGAGWASRAGSSAQRLCGQSGSDLRSSTLSVHVS